MIRTVIIAIILYVTFQPLFAFSETLADLEMHPESTYNGPSGSAVESGPASGKQSRSLTSEFTMAQAEPAGEETPEDMLRDPFADWDQGTTEEAPGTIADPLEPLNRAFFVFNDKFYFWLLKPLATGYKAVVPERARLGVRDFFYNLAFPIRFANCVFQGKGDGAFLELGRFLVNTFFGAAGFIDVATASGAFKKYDEDLGQTFGHYDVGPGIFINWPIVGPSSVRDTMGAVGDAFLNPISILIDPSKYTISLNAFALVNNTSLRLGDYEDLKRAALDPYIAVRDAYYQNRTSKIKE
jgi:phospholipid-binding lipoprotein MlaA